MSSFLTLEQSYLRDIGGEFTAKEISQQPDSWRKTLQIVQSRRQTIDAFLNPLLKKKGLRIILTGAGTSAFAGKVLAPFLTKIRSLRFEAIATTDIVSNPDVYLAEQVPTLLISFARSGNSPESVAAVNLTDQILKESYHLILTCNEQGQLATTASSQEHMLSLLMPRETNDKGFAMTSSFTSMMLSAMCIFAQDHGLPGKIEHLCTTTEQLINQRASELQQLAAERYERVVFLGSGSLRGLAEEAALKLLELTAGQVAAFHDSPLGFRHGPKSLINNKTLIIVFISAEPTPLAYDTDLLKELIADHKAGKVLAITTEELAGVGEKHLLKIDKCNNYESTILSLPFIALAQIFAFFQSVELQITPDNPCPTGEVNRVVQGVSIHPYNKN